jgi:hypothetical protein
LPKDIIQAISNNQRDFLNGKIRGGELKERNEKLVNDWIEKEGQK